MAINLKLAKQYRKTPKEALTIGTKIRLLNGLSLICIEGIFKVRL